MRIHLLANYRRNISLALALILLVSLAVTALPVGAQGTADCPIRIVMYDTLILRAGPSFGFGVTTTLVAGEVVCLTGRNAAASWLQVSRPLPTGGIIGWAPSGAFWTTVPVTVLPVTDTTTPPTPAPVTPVPIPVTPVPGGTTYVIQAGDTVFSIAQRFGITVQALVAANNIPPTYVIYIGQVLVIPAAQTPPPGNYISYTVQQGDYLVRIARQYNTTWQILASANGIQPPYTIYPGQTLLIPR